MRNLGTKIDNTAPATSGRLSAEEFESLYSELKKPITSVGISLDVAGADTDTEMLAQSISRLASLGVWGVAGGTANAITVAKSGSVVVPKALFTGMRVNTIAALTNTGATTANVFTLGAKAVRTWDDQALSGGEMQAGRPTTWEYSATANSAAGAWLILPWASALSVLKAILIPNRTIVSTVGAYSETAPANSFGARVRGWGGGGGGGHGGAAGGGAGGGSGAYFDKVFVLKAGDLVTGSIAAAGTAGTSGANGGAGGSTTVIVGGVTYTVAGGSGGLLSTTGAGNSVSGGASPSGSDFPNGIGEPSYGALSGYSGSGILYYGGKGGTAPFGGFGGMAGTGNGNSGQTPGGGGGGSAQGFAPGAGARGEVWIDWYIG